MGSNVDEFMKITCCNERKIAEYMIDLFSDDLNAALNQYFVGNIPSLSDILNGKAYTAHGNVPPPQDINEEKSDFSYDQLADNKTENLSSFTIPQGDYSLKSYSGLSSFESAEDCQKSFNGNVEKTATSLLPTARIDFMPPYHNNKQLITQPVQATLECFESDIHLGTEKTMKVSNNYALSSHAEDLYQPARTYLDYFNGDFQRALYVMMDTDGKYSDKKELKFAGMFLRAVNFDFEVAYNVLLEIYNPAESDDEESDQKVDKQSVSDKKDIVSLYLKLSDGDCQKAINKLRKNRGRKYDGTPAARYLEAYHGDYDAAMTALQGYSDADISNVSVSSRKVTDIQEMKHNKDDESHCACGNTDDSLWTPYFYHDYLKNVEAEFIGYHCKRCNHEWLVSDVLGQADKNKINESFEMLDRRLFKKKKEEPSKSQVLYTLIDVQDVSVFKQGDQFAIKRPLGYIHHGIVFRADPRTNLIEGIHFQMNNGRARVVRNMLNISEENGTLCKVNYEGFSECTHFKLVIARACSMIGDSGYNIFKNNCEHFANFCKIGIHTCYQVEKLIREVQRTFNRLSSKANVKAVFDTFSNLGGKEVAAKVGKVNAGLLIVFEGRSLIITLVEDVKQKRNGDITYIEFITEALLNITSSTITIAALISSPTVGGMLGAFFGKYGEQDLLVGSILKGRVGCLDPKKLRVIVSQALEGVFLRIIGFDCKSVVDITALQEGDHVIYYGGVLYPRCHGIVIQHDGSCVTTVRSTAHGVIREAVKFAPPFYKVIYSDNEIRDSRDTVKRGLSKLGRNRYNVLTNNGKHFAMWCKKI